MDRNIITYIRGEEIHIEGRGGKCVVKAADVEHLITSLQTAYSIVQHRATEPAKKPDLRLVPKTSHLTVVK